MSLSFVKQASEPPTPPQSVLASTLWAFRVKPYSSAVEFSEAVAHYHAVIKGGMGPPKEEARSLWKPDELVIPGHTKLELYWEGLDRDRLELVERVSRFESTSLEGFTALDLLYQVHNVMVGDCKDMDHCYFEGCFYLGISSEDGHVRYRVHQGS